MKREKFYIGLLIDVASNYCQGVSVGKRADKKLVELPVKKTLEINEGHGPKRFLLSDNYSQYISAEHEDLLDKLEIVQKNNTIMYIGIQWFCLSVGSKSLRMYFIMFGKAGGKKKQIKEKDS